ncbi:FliH/SctL family protein [Thalassospira marina]|uniref:Uncharacterized protein n=1 Tax=Thalassospira marina TaxID=2048283 RepID=A0A2N3KZB8_9PROT|nr:FliH/SctL family protein [Thalassospira marina]PKR55914.1 hypothetical protein COO20_01465 [Thalassospira marina]
MTAIEKFKFTLNFDDADTVIRPAGAEEEHYSLKRKSQTKKKEDEAPPPPPAIYTEEQMQTMLRDTETRAREEAFAQGHEQGLNQAREEILNSLEKAVADTAQLLAARLEHIDELQKRAHASTAEDGIHVTRAIVKKLLPAWVQENTTVEIESIVRKCLSNLFDAPKVLIQVHPEIAGELQARVSEIAQSRGFSGQAVVVGEASIAKGDCRVSWGDGTAVRDQARTWGEINAIVENAITAHREAHALPDNNPMADPAVQESRLPEPQPQQQPQPAPVAQQVTTGEVAGESSAPAEQAQSSVSAATTAPASPAGPSMQPDQTAQHTPSPAGVENADGTELPKGDN